MSGREFRPRHPLTHVYDAAYTGVPNWDIGRPQRPFVHLVEAGYVRSPVLDVGCGTGELSIYLASQGYDVLGVDLSALAIGQAREKARWRRSSARFLTLDALALDRLRASGLRFATVVDSAMLHVLGDRERDLFVEQLSAVVRPGGRYVVLGDERVDGRAIYGLTVAELRDRFERAAGWELEFAVETVFERRWGGTPAVFVGLRRL